MFAASTTNVISFDGLGLGPFTIDRVAIHNLFGSIDIYWYAIIITTGLILALLFGMSQAKHNGLTSDNIVDVALFGVPAALIGSRIYYVIFEWDSFETFAEMIDIRNGGLAIYGAVIAGFLTGFIYAKVKKISILALFDIGAMGFLIGQFIGRWGNFINGEAFGYVTDLIWGMTINGKGPFHPTFFYESLANFIGFILIFIYFRKFKKKNGEIVFLYMIWYGIVRMLIEGLRTDSLYIFNLRVSQVLSGVIAVVGLALFILLKAGVLDKIFAKKQMEIEKKENNYNEIYKPEVAKIPQAYIADDQTALESIENAQLDSKYLTENNQLSEAEKKTED